MSAPITESVQETLRVRLRALGFDEVRFAAIGAPAGDERPTLRSLKGWLGAGFHADMQWMERTVDKRLDPTLVLPGARTMILLGTSYWSDRLRARGDAGEAAWARYAVYEDYHDTMKPGLVAAGRALEELYGAAPADYRYYVDTGPVIDRGWSARSGLGFIGKNAMLISRTHGNWLFLAAILTRIDFIPDPPLRKPVASLPLPPGIGGATGDAVEGGSSGAVAARERATGNAGPFGAVTEAAPPVGLLCGKCTRCLDACPTDAFAAPGVVDARRCISYQTIENKGIIPRELRAGIGAHIYGCDVCLEVCPWNRFAREGRQLLLAARYDIVDLSLAEILGLTPERFAEVFRRTPIKRLKLGGLLRNACIVAGNRGDPALLPSVVVLARNHALPMVRAHAVWAAFRLGGGGQLVDARLGETDPTVLAEYAAEDSAG